MKRRQKGTGSVWKDEKTGKWKGQIQVGVLQNGHKKLKTITGSSAKEVKTKLDRIKAELLTGGYVDSSSMTIPKLATQLNDEKYKLNHIKATTYIRNAETIKIINSSVLSTIPIQNINELILKDFYCSVIDYSNSVIKKIYNQINATLKKAVKLNIIKTNPNEDIMIPKSNKDTKKISAFTIDEQKKFIQAVNTENKEPYRTMLLLSLFTGMRMGEICALQIFDYNSSMKTIKIERTLTRDDNDIYVIGSNTKSAAGIRTIKITNYVCELLDNYIRNDFKLNVDKLLFIQNGKYLTTSQVNSYFKRLVQRYEIINLFKEYRPLSEKHRSVAFKKYTFLEKTKDGYKKIGIKPDDWDTRLDKYYYEHIDYIKPYNQHMLRHTFATRCIEGGISAKVLQTKMGHSDIKITMNTYADVFEQFEDVEDNKIEQYLLSQNII